VGMRGMRNTKEKFKEKNFFSLSFFIVENNLPEVDEHLKKVSLPLDVISLPWFMCLFIGYIPFRVRTNYATIFPSSFSYHFLSFAELSSSFGCIHV
jgi:hypothetical protein